MADAKNNLSRHLAYVQRGGHIRILLRDIPVADLVPVDSSVDTKLEDKDLVRLERLGVLRRGKPGPVPRELLRPGPNASRASVTEALIDQRRSSR